MRHLLFATLLFASACGGASQTPSEPATDGTAGATAEPGTADPAAGEDCYVESVDDQPGCWDDADAACDEVCGAPCVCTEASSRNSCSC
ncbi:MAG TPA: hypothetical protein RMH99_07535 [Sandaracinaceae bacterium LLY-WYZ-13_1]|nr:hypothetical protein [Sandaracinaceae bacterium LLY-WYZ-13_1]